MNDRQIDSQNYHNFQSKGNGILCCYNMFPRQFSNINEMTNYLKTISSMGFNAVWINPIQATGGVEGGGTLTRMDKNNGIWENNKVKNCIYAMQNPDQIDKAFSVAPRDELGNLLVTDEEARKLDQEALQEFTQKAKQQNLVPMFDLVLNHVSADSTLCQQHPHWFKGIDPQFKDAKKFNYDDPVIRAEIIETLWKPYIEKYMVTYGFDGVRVDAVGHLHPQLRAEIYDFINQLCEIHNKPKPVILDEALFSEGDISNVVDSLLLTGTGPTHITTGAYYATRDPYSAGMPDWTKSETDHKSKVVFLTKENQLRKEAKGGTVNFSGNHDHTSLAMQVMREMAQNRLNNDPIMHPLYERVKKSLNYKGYVENDESREIKFLFSYMQDIQNELQNNNENTVIDFERRMKEKIAMCALSSSGGWFLLSGDEYSDTFAKPVFLRENNQEFYMQREHNIFSTTDAAIQAARDEVFKIMAIELMKQDTVSTDHQVKLSHNGMYGIYLDLANQPDKQERLLQAYIDNIKHLMNSGIPSTCQQFSQLMESKGITVNFESSDYTEKPRNSHNHWQGIHDMSKYIKRINQLLITLPKSEFGYWSELIAIPNKPDLMVLVRKNGIGFNSPTSVAVVNLSNQRMSLTKNDLHHIACEFQKRTVSAENQHMGNPDFDAAYNTIMQATIYNDKSIEVDPILKGIPEISGLFRNKAHSCPAGPAANDMKFSDEKRHRR